MARHEVVVVATAIATTIAVEAFRHAVTTTAASIVVTTAVVLVMTMIDVVTAEADVTATMGTAAAESIDTKVAADATRATEEEVPSVEEIDVVVTTTIALAPATEVATLLLPVRSLLVNMAAAEITLETIVMPAGKRTRST